MKKSKTHYYVFALGNLLFWIPIVLLFLNIQTSKLIDILIDTVPLYVLFLSFMLMVFQLGKKMDVAFVFNEFMGIQKVVTNYYSEYIKEKKGNIVWLIFWISILVCVVQTIILFVA